MTIIPSRVAPLAVPSPRAFLALSPELSTPAAEKRRVLPSLIVAAVPQAEPAPTLDADDVGPPRRERVRKRPLAPAEPSTVEPSTVEPRPAGPSIAGPSIAGLLVAAAEGLRPASAVPPRAREDDHLSTRVPRRRATKSTAALPPGERWKRRLGRWSR